MLENQVLVSNSANSKKSMDQIGSSGLEQVEKDERGKKNENLDLEDLGKSQDKGVKEDSRNTDSETKGRRR